MKKVLFSLSALVIAALLSSFSPAGNGPAKEKIGGVSVVSPPNEIDDKWTHSVKRINAEWVALLPYGFSYAGSPEVIYNQNRQWWGERMEGMTELIRHCKKNGLKVMLKPMVWVMGSWPGGYDLEDERQWSVWEQTYSKYILETAAISEAEGVDLFCIGTEFKIASSKREAFWRKLAGNVREVYSGKITYAANWDEFEMVKFWDVVDYIGIDAYFPLVDQQTPDPSTMVNRWKGPAKKFELLHKVYGKQVLFTEFGYRSINRCAWNQWELEGTPYTKDVNLQSQVNAYQAFFDYFWEKEWFAGMFLWQWYTNDKRAGGHKNSDYTPQHKPAEQLISSYFGK